MAGNTTISDTYDRVFTTTRTHIIPNLFDNITADIPTIYELKKRDRVMKVSGGAALEFNVLKELPTAVGAKATQKVTPVYLDPATRGRYVWKNIYVPFKMAGQDMRKNESEEAVVDFVAMHIEAVRAAMASALGGSALGIWSSADETDETILTGFGNLIKSTAASNTTGNTGNIARTNTWWQNQIGTAITSFATNGVSGWRSTLFLCKRMNEHPDLIITNNTQLQNYLNALTNTFRMNFPIERRLVSETAVDAGVGEATFYGATILGDSNAFVNQALFVNTKYLKLYIKEGADMLLSEFMLMTDEDAVTARLIAMLNLCATNIARQGVDVGGDSA